MNDEDLSHGFDRGNYASAYETDDFEGALGALPPEVSEDYRTAFTLGFFASFEFHEAGEHEETLREAYASDAGKRCIELGYVDTPTEGEDAS